MSKIERTPARARPFGDYVKRWQGRWRRCDRAAIWGRWARLRERAALRRQPLAIYAPFMWPIFNKIMRVVSSLVGVLMILMGTVWMLQGLNLAFRVGFMVGDRHWTLYGAILALVGIAQVVWSNTRTKI